MRLLNSQKNELYDAIEVYGLSPAQFEFVNTKSIQSSPEVATMLCYKGTDYYFLFDTHYGGHYASFSPGEQHFNDEAHTSDWDTQLMVFDRWLEYLSREINSPNKWERLESEMKSIRFNFTNDEDKFSFHEYEDLKLKVETLKSSINNLGLLGDQAHVFNDKLDHLVELAKDMNKFDWKSLFVGTIISVIIQLSVTQDNAKELWTLIKQIFSTYLMR
ncbi:MAG: hypothetical protein C0448_15555 [Sphingobacteriaceae bacterium]|nr:hypothetical protein [Sphingobacteriaceae bacterium]